MTEKDWPFDQAPNVAAITSKHIIRQGCPILLVTHYADDESWGFQSGKPVGIEDAQVVGMGSIFQLDPTLSQIADLPPGWSAEREFVGGEWKRYKQTWEENEE
jgi:hypothetical protein